MYFPPTPNLPAKNMVKGVRTKWFRASTRGEGKRTARLFSYVSIKSLTSKSHSSYTHREEKREGKPLTRNEGPMYLLPTQST